MAAIGKLRADTFHLKLHSSPNGWVVGAMDRGDELPEVLVAVSTSRLSCKRAGKTRTLMSVWDSSGKSRLRSSSSDRVDGKLIAVLLFRTDHSRNDLGKADPWSPAELPCRLRGVAPRIANVCGTSERIIAFNVVLPSQSNFGKRGRHKLIQPVGCTRSNNKILGPIMLKHHPHRFYIVWRPAPVAVYRNVAQL
jgi:hypothetical protein